MSKLLLRGSSPCFAVWTGAARSSTSTDCCVARTRERAALLRVLGMTHGTGARCNALHCWPICWRRGPCMLGRDIIACYASTSVVCITAEYRCNPGCDVRCEGETVST